MRRALVLVVLSTMAWAAPFGTAPAGAMPSDWSSTDPAGDVGHCEGDVVETRAAFDTASLDLALRAACPSDPSTADAWVVGVTSAMWMIERVGMTGGFWYALFANDGEAVFATVVDGRGVEVCGATPAWDGGAWFSVAIDAGCLGDHVRVSAELTWDESPFSDSCVCAVDAAPDGGLSPMLRKALRGQGYWMVTRTGDVHAFGDAPWLGNRTLTNNVVDLEPTPSGRGYWLLGADGAVTPHGDAMGREGPPGGNPGGPLRPGETATAISATPTGNGYWVFTSFGRAYAFGDAPHLGDMGTVRLNGPVLDAIATPTGRGYYMVGSDGGIFTFGDALFDGSMGATPLNAPVQSLVPDPDGRGYWLVASDGGIFSFEAAFHGSTGSLRLNRPITGMVGFRAGYLMVGEDGGIFSFGEAPFFGSLGDTPPPTPVVSVAVLDR